MNFASDKDLRKAVPKKVAGKPKPTNTNNNITSVLRANPSLAPNSDNIIEKVKVEREQRQIKYELSRCVVKIQSWYRGRSTSIRYYTEMLLTFDKKLTDVDKLSKLLVSKGLPPLVPPTEICLSLMATLNVLIAHSKKDYTAKLSLCCELLLLPTLCQLESNKNIVLAEYKKSNTFPILSKSFVIMLNVLTRTATTSTTSSALSRVSKGSDYNDKRDIYCECVSLFLGRGEPYKMKYTNELAKAFECFREQLVASRHIYLLFRKYFIQSVSHLMTNKLTDHTISSQSKHTSIKYPPSIGVHDQMFEMCLFLTQCDPFYHSDRQQQFILCIFSVPMLTLVLSSASFVSLCRSMLFTQLLTNVALPEMVCPPDYVQIAHVITTHQWILGNIAALVGSMPIVNTGVEGQETAVAAMSDESLLMYLNVLSNWLSEGSHTIPGVLQGRDAIVWRRSGATSTAVGVPSGLAQQILTILDVGVLSNLTERVLLPSSIGSEGWDRFTTAQDKRDISDALSSSGYVVAHRALLEQQAASTWFTAKWAEKLTKSVQKSFSISSMLPSFFGGGSSSGSSGGSDRKKESSVTAMSNTSKQVAVDMDTASTALCGKQTHYYVNPELQDVLCKIWCALLPIAAMAKSSADTVPRKALTYLAFSTSNTVEKLWTILLLRCGDVSALEKLPTQFVFDPSSAHNVFAGGGRACNQFDVLMSLVAVLRVTLIALDDSELYEQSKPLPLHQIVAVVRCLKVVLYRFMQSDPQLFLDQPQLSDTAEEHSPKGKVSLSFHSSSAVRSSRSEDATKNIRLHRYSCAKATISVLSDLYTRWARRPFSASSLWEITDTSTSVIKEEIRLRSPFGIALMRSMPWSVDFHQRMKLIRNVLDYERTEVQGSNDIMSGGTGYRSKGQVIRVRRARVLEDGMSALSKIPGALIKDRVVVRYVNDFGEDEAGIDIGGLFKDFVTDLSSRIFDPSYGLFSLTSTNVLFPNPAASMLYEQHELDDMYVFLGRVLGKALFENITLQPQFAHFFLAFMHGRYNFMSLIDDLGTLDPELYKNLMFLKSYEGDIADLALTFCITDTALGGNTEIELIPGGSNLYVTSSNKYRYVNLIAKYYLHDRLKRQAGAFFSGLYQVISPDLLGMFCAPELQILISGAQTGVDADDLKRNTRYAGGYLAIDRHMSRFWTVFAEMSTEDKALLVKFVTSCERPPSLGFAGLNPPFTIQRVECSDDSRLPTASTCFNILKLPTYSSQSVLRDKLLLSIRSKSGFDLS